MLGTAGHGRLLFFDSFDLGAREPTKMTTSLRCSAFLPRVQLLVLAGSVLSAPLAYAQSSGSLAVEEALTEVTVSASRIKSLGTVVEQNATKTRVAITQEYLQTQQAGQTIMQSLNQVPGVNFTNNDAYGGAGGNLRIRGFDGSRISATFDGMPINDSGNYALFTNQLLDPELIEQVDVNLGTTDVDSPTASATGGTVAFRSLTPASDMGGLAVLTGGSDSYKRGLLRLDTGEFGPWGTKGWISASYTTYDKFKGPGDIWKRQYNAKLIQDIGDRGDFISLAAYWNENRNYSLRNAARSSYVAYGFDYDYIATCTRDAPTRGVADNENATPVATTPALLAADNPANTSSCTNFYGVRLNPSDNGNLRAQSLFHLGEKFRLAIDPSFQFTLANGGGAGTFQSESIAANNPDRRLLGNTTLPGLDLNGDGDILDTIRFYNPSTTNTKRWGLTSSLIYDITDEQLVRVSYSLDYARHRQTGMLGLLDANGFPETVWGGRRGTKIYTVDGFALRTRDRYSIASLNQVAGEYRGEFFDKRLVTQIGVRAPFFKRNLNQYCYTPDGGTGTNGGSLCTSQTPSATLPNGNVQFSGAAAQYIAPYSATLKFDDVLPNLGATYKLTDANTLYASYAENLSAPRTDNLYPVRRVGTTVVRLIPEPEKTKAMDFGWRFNTPTILASAAVYFIDYDNRIASAYDPDLNITTDRNLGKVKIKGLDLQAGYQPISMLTFSGGASYNDSEVQDNLQNANGSFAPTAGKKLVETPEWTYSLRTDLKLGSQFRAGLQGKYVSKRYSTDVNDEYANAYQVFDFDASYTFELPHLEKLELQLNIQNLFDKDYFGSISSGTGLARNTGGTVDSVGFFNIGAPRTTSLSVKVAF
jgi:iron complex outermembrane recepter protein